MKNFTTLFNIENLISTTLLADQKIRYMELIVNRKYIPEISRSANQGTNVPGQSFEYFCIMNDK
jgi:hypothetical protein